MTHTSTHYRPRGAATAALALAFAALFAANAWAQGNTSGTYTLEVEEVSSSCDKSVTLKNDTRLTITQTSDELAFQTTDLPTLAGKARARGKFRVEGADTSPRSNGTKGRYSGTGRFDAKSVRMVLVAEYVKDGKVQCTQSWNITGKK